MDGEQLRTFRPKKNEIAGGLVHLQNETMEFVSSFWR
jgi:hypothetical protein